MRPGTDVVLHLALRQAALRRAGLRTVVLLLLLPLLACLACDRAHHQFITDEQGRALILHGANVSNSAKDAPDQLPWITRDDALRLSRDWGFNFARFLIFWDAVEPDEPGVYDDAYLAKVRQRLDWLHDAGVFVVLDMHQDVYGKVDSDGRAIGFNGAPAWAFHTDGIPFAPAPVWSFNYFAKAVLQAFDHFWGNPKGTHPELRGHYAAMWAHVAEVLGDHPALLGYDLMNEPFAGSPYAFELIGEVRKNLERQAEWDRTTFTAWNQSMIDAIRTVDTDSWIFFEPRAVGPNWGNASHLGPLVDPRAGESRLVFFPHFYSALAELQFAYAEDDPALADWESARRAENELHRAPLLVGEFGVLMDFEGDAEAHLNQLLAAVDRIGSGWSYWSYDRGNGAFSFIDAERNEIPPIDALVRPYPQRIAGEPLGYGYDPDTRVFYLMFEDKQGVRGPTEIYVPAARHYPDGWELEVSDGEGTWSSQWDGDREMLSVWTNARRSLHGVIIRPAATTGQPPPRP